MPRTALKKPAASSSAVIAKKKATTKAATEKRAAASKSSYKAATKKPAAASKSYYKIVDGVKYDRELYESCLDQYAQPETLTLKDVKALLAQAEDGPGITAIERRTLLHVMKVRGGSPEAAKLLNDALQEKGKSYYKIVNGVKYDRELYESCLEDCGTAEPLTEEDVRALLEKAEDGPGITDTERRTLLHILEVRGGTPAAEKLLGDRLNKKLKSHYKASAGIFDENEEGGGDDGVSKAAEERATTEKSAGDKAAAEKNAAEQAVRAAQELAATEKAAEEKAVAEKAAAVKAAAEKAAGEQASKGARELAAAKKAAEDKAAADKALAETAKAAQELAATKKAAEEKAAAEKAEAVRAAAEKAAAEQASKFAQELAAAKKAEEEKAAADKAAAETAKAAQAAAEQASNAARELTAAKNAAEENAAADKAAAELTKAAQELAAAKEALEERSAAEQAAADKATAEEGAAEKTAADKAAEEEDYIPDVPNYSQEAQKAHLAAAELEAQEEQGLKLEEKFGKIFDAIDTSGDGQCDGIELKTYFNIISPREKAELGAVSLEQFLLEADTSGDGQVSRSEFVAYFAFKLIDRHACYDALFDAIDVSGDGSLQYDEVKEFKWYMYPKLFQLLGILNFTEMAQGMDHDGDGDITKKEFVDFLEKKTQAQDSAIAGDSPMTPISVGTSSTLSWRAAAQASEQWKSEISSVPKKSKGERRPDECWDFTCGYCSRGSRCRWKHYEDKKKDVGSLDRVRQHAMQVASASGLNLSDKVLDELACLTPEQVTAAIKSVAAGGPCEYVKDKGFFLIHEVRRINMNAHASEAWKMDNPPPKRPRTDPYTAVSSSNQERQAAAVAAGGGKGGGYGQSSNSHGNRGGQQSYGYSGQRSGGYGASNTSNWGRGGGSWSGGNWSGGNYK